MDHSLPPTHIILHWLATEADNTTPRALRYNSHIYTLDSAKRFINCDDGSIYHLTNILPTCTDLELTQLTRDDEVIYARIPPLRAPTPCLFKDGMLLSKAHVILFDVDEPVSYTRGDGVPPLHELSLLDNEVLSYSAAFVGISAIIGMGFGIIALIGKLTT